MMLPRRRFLRLAGAAAALWGVSCRASADSYPLRPVRLLVGFPAGGPTDIFARLIGQWLSERLGQQFIIENRPGVGSNLATEAVANAAPDGYTLLFVTAASAIGATFYDKLSFVFLRDIAPIAGVVRGPLVMVVNPAVPAKTVPEFIAYAKANPGKINMASVGNGTSPHLAGELFKAMAGVNMLHVPYRGAAPALTDLIAGQVQVMFEGMASLLDHGRTGKLRLLGVTTATRSPVLPELPTVGEFVPGYEASQWYGVGAPRGTPAEIVAMLNKEINAGLADPKIKGRFSDLGGTVLVVSPAEFGKLLADETEKWGKVVKFTGAKPE
jgi:tripartite-type tricarboxylate transporter receptor subunit TctC